MNFVVSYSDQFIYKNLNGGPVESQIAPAPSGAAYLALYGLDQVFLYGQSGTRNVIGDSMAAIYTDQIQGNTVPLTTLWASLTILW